MFLKLLAAKNSWIVEKGGVLTTKGGYALARENRPDNPATELDMDTRVVEKGLGVGTAAVCQVAMLFEQNKVSGKMWEIVG